MIAADLSSFNFPLLSLDIIIGSIQNLSILQFFDQIKSKNMPPFSSSIIFNILLLIIQIALSSSSPQNPLRQLAHRRHKRDFMLAAGNSTDPMPSCFQKCNREWRHEFEREFGLNVTDFYDFPFHPKVLDYASFLAYCRLSNRQTRCFIERCGDQSADRVFSPSNFLCTFKRQHFLRARACLEESEPISFLRCDQSCHPGDGHRRAELGKVFGENEMDGYERELDTLCTFQQCYGKCHEEIIGQICSPGQAAISTELVRTYLQWHSADLLDWHILTGNERMLPESCAQLAHLELGNNHQPAEKPMKRPKKLKTGEDPVLKAMAA